MQPFLWFDMFILLCVEGKMGNPCFCEQLAIAKGLSLVLMIFTGHYEV